MVFVIGVVTAIFLIAYLMLIYLYYKTRYKPHLYGGVALFLFSLATVFALLISAAVSVNNLPLIKLFGRCSTTSGALAFFFLNMFAIAIAKPGEKTRATWITFSFFLVIAFIVWTFNFSVEGNIGGMPVYMFTSMYKAPYGLPLVEIIITSMGVLAVYPASLFFRVAKNTRDRVIRTQSLLLGIGMIIATTAYAIEATGAIPYQYMPIAIPMIMVGTTIIILGYVIPIQIDRLLFGSSLAGEETVKSFLAKFSVYPVAPTVRTQPNAFSEAIGLTHQQIVGKKIIYEFDPGSQYEKPIQDLAAEASANAEPTFIFTRMGSALHSSLKEQKAVKFFCLTQKVSVPTEFSENEMLLPAKDTSLMLDVFDKTLQAHSKGNINVVFDSLTDLVMIISFEKTYRFMRYTIEMLGSQKTTVLFLLNQTAHDPKIMHDFRNLFSNQISFGKDGIQRIKSPTHTA
jgi:hypothetical protein